MAVFLETEKSARTGTYQKVNDADISGANASTFDAVPRVTGGGDIRIWACPCVELIGARLAARIIFTHSRSPSRLRLQIKEIW
jgi:hypothetical protein